MGFFCKRDKHHSFVYQKTSKIFSSFILITSTYNIIYMKVIIWHNVTLIILRFILFQVQSQFTFCEKTVTDLLRLKKEWWGEEKKAGPCGCTDKKPNYISISVFQYISKLSNSQIF